MKNKNNCFNLFCKIFGHKFFFTSFQKTGKEYLSYIGLWIDVGNTYRHETSYCTRCGFDRIKLNEEIKNINTRK